MLEENPDIQQPQSPDQAPPGWRPFQPESYVTEGVQIERQHILAGSMECSPAPFLVIGIQDGPAVKVTQKHRGRMRSRMSVIGDVEICPADFSDGVVIMDRPTDQIYVGIHPHVISNTAESAGIDPGRVSIVASLGAQDPTIHHVARRLLQERRASGLGGRLYTDALVTELVVHLLREYSSAGAPEKDAGAGGVEPGRLAPALELIHDNIQANLSLKALADAARLSPHHFSRVFKRVTGYSPHQYVLSQRVQLARRLLVETSLPVAEVSHQVGFYDQSHFTYHFKRLVGITPMAMRRRKNVLPE